MNDPIAGQRWVAAMAETVCVVGCTCIFCTRRTADAEAEDHTRTIPRSHPRRSSIIEVVYPASYLGTPPNLPDPPSYCPGDTTAQEDHREHAERTPLISSTTTTMGGALVPSSHHDSLVEVSSLTGAPYGRVTPAEPSVPVIDFGLDVLEEAEPPPAYSRFDESRLRLPVASDVLGPLAR